MNEKLHRKVSPPSKGLIFKHIFFTFKEGSAWRAENPIATVTSVGKA